MVGGKINLSKYEQEILIDEEENWNCIHLEDENCPYHLGCIALGDIQDCDYYIHKNQINGSNLIL